MTDQDQPPAAQDDALTQDDALALVGHELRSPLTSVLGYAQLLAAGSLTDEQCGYVATIERNGRRLLRVIDELLVGARLAAGEHDVTRRPLDLADVARTRATELTPAATAAGVTLTVATPRPVTFSGDPELLDQLVTSLLSDAVRRTPRGGNVHLLVERRARHGTGPTHDAVVEVTGSTGVSARVSTGVSTGAGALGLGLPVVRAIVDAHGGTLDVGSAPDGGTRVTVTLWTTATGSTPR